ERAGRLPGDHPRRARLDPWRGGRRHYHRRDLPVDAGLRDQQHPRHQLPTWHQLPHNYPLPRHDPRPAGSSLRALWLSKGGARMSVSTPVADSGSAPAHPQARRSSRERTLLLGGLIVLGLVFLYGGDAWLSVLDFTMIAAIATLGLNVLSGYAGQV